MFVFKYLYVGRSYVGIWYVLNNGVIISEAVTFESLRSTRARDIFVYINMCYHSNNFRSTVTIHFYLS